jgi:hypothetical protein
MRRMFPSLPILAYLSTNVLATPTLRGDSISEAKPEPRAVVDSRGEQESHLARAASLEPASAKLEERSSNGTLEERQDYYAFSGAVYIVGEGGQPLSGLNAASPAYCPNSAPQSCGNIQVWNW